MALIQPFATALKCYLYFLSLLLVIGCGEPPPSIDEVKSRFAAQRAAAEELKAMIIEDAKNKDRYAVGLDHIGVYWKHSGDWNNERNYQTKLSLSQVLHAEGISDERYNKYKSLFDRLKAERITHFGGAEKTPLTKILIYRAGLAVSGCAMELVATPVVPEAKGRRGSGDFVEITTLGGGWYVQYDCT